MKKESSSLNYGLLLLRIGIGLMFFFHGLPKVLGGIEKWEKLGGAMSHLGIQVYPVFWGFMASVSECFGGLLLAAGLLFTPTCGLLFITMAVASMKHISVGDSFAKSSHAVEAAILFFSLMLIGPGSFTLNKLWKSR